LALGLTDDPLVGGISKWSSTRDDLVARDAACAGADRAQNAFDNEGACIESAAADVAQVDALRAQMVDAADRAVQRRQVSIVDRRRLRALSARAGTPPERASFTTEKQYERKVARYHRRSALALARACRLLSTGRGR
jgi:hypothetical protein